MKMSKNYFLILFVSLGVVGTIWFSSKLATEAVVALARIFKSTVGPRIFTL